MGEATYATALDWARAEDPALAEQYAVVRAQVGGAPTLSELLACCERGTHEGVLESALHLPMEDFTVLEARVKQAAKAASVAYRKAWRTRRRSS